MNTPTDLDINRSIRRIMVKHWIDLGRIAVRSSRGMVTIHGILRRIPGTEQELTTPIVERIFYDIGRLPGVKNVRTRLDNWGKEGGRWHPVDGSRAALLID